MTTLLRDAIVVASLFATLTMPVEARVWTDRDGRQVEATFVRIHQGRVILKDAEGRAVPIPLSSLSDADQQFVRQKAGLEKPKEDKPRAEPEDNIKPLMREWTDQDGIKVRAALVGVKDGMILLRKSGKVMPVALERFSIADQDGIRKYFASQGKTDLLPKKEKPPEPKKDPPKPIDPPNPPSGESEKPTTLVCGKCRHRYPAEGDESRECPRCKKMQESLRKQHEVSRQQAEAARNRQRQNQIRKEEAAARTKSATPAPPPRFSTPAPQMPRYEFKCDRGHTFYDTKSFAKCPTCLKEAEGGRSGSGWTAYNIGRMVGYGLLALISLGGLQFIFRLFSS